MSEQGFASFAELAAAQGWSEQEQKEQLLASLSDVYKYVYGVRPRGVYSMEQSVEYLAAQFEQLSAEADAEAERQAARDAVNRRAFEAQVARGMYGSVEDAEYQQYGYPSREAFGLLELDRYAPAEATYNPFSEALS